MGTTPETPMQSSSETLEKKKSSSNMHQMLIVNNSRVQLLIFMAVAYVAVNHLDLFKHATNTLISNIRMMLLLLNLIIIYFGVLFLPDSSKKRGMSMFWRIAQASAFAYALNLLVFLFFSKENLQYVLNTVYDNSLGKPLGERSYADDCRVFTPEHPTSYFANITGSFDMFVAAHFIGWTFKVWICRDSTTAWILSIAFEIMEWTMEVWLPNFRECWWDHFLFDLFGCNLLGMLIGFYTMKKFKMRSLNWFIEPSEEFNNLSWLQKVRYSFAVRSEYKRQDKWHWLAEPWTFLGVLWFWFMNLYLDLSYFYNKSMLEIPPPHWLCSVRIWVLAFFAIIASNDYFDYLVTRKCSSMTFPIFLLLFLKNYNPGLFNNPLHLHIQVFWLAFFALVGGVLIFLCVEKYRQNRKMIPEDLRKSEFKAVEAH